MASQILSKGSSPKLAGVCSGIAEFLGWSTTAVRITWVLGTLLSGGVGGVVAYAVMAYVMPNRTGFDLHDFRVQ